MYEISLLAAGAVVFAFVAQCLSAAHVVAEREAKDTAALSLAAVNPTFAVALNTVWSMRALLVDGESERAGFTQEGEIPMDCTSESASHYAGCPCHEERWRERLAAAEAARERAEKERDEARDCGNSTTEDACGECRACWLITKASLCGRVAAAESALASEREAHSATKREREAAESRAARLLTALKHLLKAFLMLHRACGTGSAEQWPEVEDARAALAAEEGK